MKFPDEYFPIPEDFKEDYINKIQSGKEYSKGLKVLFCAACKDVEKTIAIFAFALSFRIRSTD